MAKTVDINNPPAGGFKEEGWYWDPAVQQARQFYKGQFGPPGDAGAKWWLKVPEATAASPIEQVNQAIQKSFQDLQNEVIKRFGQYQGGKPFSVDEVLAQKKIEAAEQIDPYYDQILGDYLLGVQRKINRGTDDTKELLSELSASEDSFTQQSALALSDATEKAAQGFAESGLYGSGEQLSTEGKIKVSSGLAVDDYTRKVGSQRKQLTTGLSRNIEDIGLEKKGYVSDLERNRFTDIGTRAGQLAKETGQQYIQGFQATLPTELQSASGFDMLKSLGIYS